MTPKEIYQKYINRRAYIDGKKGIVVGYTSFEDDCLIMSVICGYGWTTLGDDDVILNMFDNNLGYWYVSKKNIIFKFGH